jgi:hypothetical protein
VSLGHTGGRTGYVTIGVLKLLEYLYTKEGDPSRITWLL